MTRLRFAATAALMGTFYLGLGSFASGQGLTFERWNSVSSPSILMLQRDAVNVRVPNSTQTVATAEIPSNAADSYGGRLRGWVTAPQTGDYTFFVAGDDSAELWLSSDNSRFNRKLIAFSRNPTTARQWNKFASQRSQVVRLIQGQSYYLEGWVKESTSSDNLAVGWHRVGVPTYTSSDFGTATGTWTPTTPGGYAFSIASGGLGGTSDSASRSSRSWTGDGEFVVNLEQLAGSTGTAQAGLMLRVDSAANGRHVFIGRNVAGQSSFLRRTTLGGNTSTTLGSLSGKFLRLVRAGNIISASVSTDGVQWVSARQLRTDFAGTLVSTTLSAPDGLSSSSTSIGVANPATSVTTLGTSGNMTQSQVSPDGSYSISTVVAGRPDVSAFYNSGGTLIASSATRNATNTPGSGYDSLGRPTHSYDSRTGVSTTAYLSTTADIAASTTDPGNRTTSFTYDVQGRQVSVNAPDTLDANGAVLANITTTSYFPDGNIQEINGGQTYRVSHTYDYADRQKTLTTYGTNPAVTIWTYSPTRGFLTRKEYADGKGTNYTYTAAGRLATRTWARGVTTTYGYDSGGRLTTTDYSDSTPDVTLAYDSLGRKISEIQANRSAFTFTYNPANLAPASETLAYDLNADGTPDFTRVLDRSQDNLGRATGWQLKDGATVENQVAYAFDPAGRFGNVTSPAGTFTYAYKANSMGLLHSVTGPAHTVTNTWESTRDVLTRKENMVGASIISAYDYSVNPTGQRTDVEKTGTAFASTRSIAWGYDSLGQVTKADSSVGFNRAYEYDGIGNRKKSADSLTLPGADNYTANALNQYTSVNAITPAYDDDGNATAYPVPAHLTANSTLAWDAENRLISASVNGATTIYLYDSGSRRIAQTTGSATTIYVYDGWNPVAEYTGSTLTKTYTWGLDLSGSLQGAGGVGGLLAVTEGITSHFPTYDGNGNISEYLDSTGAAAAHYEYDPFGRTTVASGANAGDFSHRFSTKPIDFPTGLYYYGYRWMDPQTGRWPSRDPIEEEGGINLYGLVGNDPTNSIDNLGKSSFNPGLWRKVACEALLRLIEELRDHIEIRVKQMKEDSSDLYMKAREVPHPDFPGTWKGHGIQLKGAQNLLEKMLKLLSRKCPNDFPPPGAYWAVRIPAPKKPDRYRNPRPFPFPRTLPIPQPHGRLPLTGLQPWQGNVIIGAYGATGIVAVGTATVVVGGPAIGSAAVVVECRAAAGAATVIGRFATSSP